MNIIAEFTLWFLAAEALVFFVQLPLNKKQFKTGARVGLIAGKALLGILLAVLVLAGPVQLRAVQPFMMALYAALFTDAVADAAYTLFISIKKKKRKFGAFKALSLALGALFFVYGVVNMQTVSPNYHVYASNKLSSDHTIVFIADMHVGSAQPFSVTEKTVEEIKALRPDATILGGDIVDDYTSLEEMQRAFGLFRDFPTPVYFVYGNHDRQGHAEYAGGRKFTEEQLEQAASDAGVTVLRDQFVQLAPDLIILGREDVSQGELRKPAEELSSPSPDAYLVVADHQPTDFSGNIKIGADLQLSGHTHAGQLFPLRALYSLIGKVYGDYTEGDAVMNVSAGACGWRMPFRTDARCQYEVIRLTPGE